MSAAEPHDCGMRDTAGAYLLGALPDHELYPFEVHLAGCPLCQGDIEELTSAVDMLGAAVPMVAAPPALGDRIKGIVRAEAELLSAAGPEADRAFRAAPRRKARTSRWSALRPRMAVAGMLATAAVCGVVVGASLLGSATPATRAISAQVLQPGVAHDASATLHVTGNSGTLTVSHFPSPPAGRVYEVWLQGTGSPRPTDSLFRPNSSGSATVAVPGSLRGVRRILVTDEPLGGSPAPTRSPIISASTQGA